MLSCFRGVRAARRDDRPSFGDTPRAEALERFDRLRIREVRAVDGQTASTFLAKFQSITAGLEPDERIELVVYTHKSMKLLRAVLSDSQANKICSLKWWSDGKKDMNSIAPLLISSCPELASLEVCFKHHFAFDFVSSMLEHPSNKLKVLEMPEYAKGGSARFFAALGQSQVSALALCYSPKFAQGLCEYLARDLLVRLKVWMKRKQVPLKMMSLSKCTHLAKLEMWYCKFSEWTTFTLSKSITKLVLYACTFVGGLDWSFLADSNVRELGLDCGKGVDGNQLGGALAVHLRAKGLDELRFYDCDFADETLAAAGVEIGRIKRLDFEGNLSDASIKLIALALQSPNSEVKELRLWYDDMAGSVEDHLVPVLKHPNCNLAKLSLRAYRDREAAGRVEAMFRKRLALFVLLQGRQVRRRSSCPLRRLPVEMLRLVGKVLI